MKWPVYWKVYWGHSLAILAAGVSLPLLGLWMFHIGLACDIWETLGRQAEPLLLLIGTLILVFGGTKFVGNLREIRAQIPTDGLEAIEDATLEPWRAVNHSFSRIEWTPDINPRLLRSIQRFCRKYRLVWPGPQFRLGFCIIEQLREETGTTNFRLLKFIGRTRFIRVYKNVHPLQLRSNAQVLDLLVKRDVFGSNACQPLQAQLLRPHAKQLPGHLLSNTAVASPAGVFHDAPVAVQVFPYADFDGHFRGKRLGNLFEVGRQLGKIQNALPTMTDDEGRQDVVEFQKTRPIGKLELPPAEILETWKTIKDCPTHDANGNPSQASLPLLLSKEIPRLDEVMNATARLRASNESEPLLLLLHDIHPHNVAMRYSQGDRCDACVLIYDYYWTGLWNHGTVTALAIHRFAREFVREQAPFPAHDRRDGMPHEKAANIERAILIRRATHAFLRGYQESDKRELPAGFLPELGDYINSGNVEKLLGCLRKTLGLEVDPLMRSAARLEGEVRKFVRFTKEAEAFSAAFKGAPNVPRFIAMSEDAIDRWNPEELAVLRGIDTPESTPKDSPPKA